MVPTGSRHKPFLIFSDETNIKPVFPRNWTIPTPIMIFILVIFAGTLVYGSCFGKTNQRKVNSSTRSNGDTENPDYGRTSTHTDLDVLDSINIYSRRRNRTN